MLLDGWETPCVAPNGRLPSVQREYLLGIHGEYMGNMDTRGIFAGKAILYGTYGYWVN